jgi:hypothetical protein
MTVLLRTQKTWPGFGTHERALDEWRRQARLVSDMWQTYLGATREGRNDAFRAYVAALDAEEAAATELAGFSLAKVA